MNGNQDPLTPRSIENVWTAMRSFFNWAAPELELSFRPDKYIKRPRYKATEIVPFTESEVKRLLKACDRTP